MYRIENISDQIKQYAQDVAEAVLDISEQYDFDAPEAVEIVKIAAMAMQADVLHHIEDAIREHSTQIGYVSDALALNAIGDAISAFPTID